MEKPIYCGRCIVNTFDENLGIAGKQSVCGGFEPIYMSYITAVTLHISNTERINEFAARSLRAVVNSRKKLGN